VDEFRDLRHVATISRLVKDDIDTVQGAFPIAPVADITLDELGPRRNPRRYAMGVGLWFDTVKYAHAPTTGQRGIDNMRADQPGSPSY